MPIRLLLFGPPAVEVDGARFDLPFERRTQLAAFLALKRAWVGRAELAALFWPELPGNLAYSNLRKALFRLQALPWAAATVQAQAGAVRCEAATDVHMFDVAVREGRSAAALPLRRGELLAGFDDPKSAAWTEWLAFERERLTGAWRRAALERIGGEEPAAAIALSQQLLEVDPLDEVALRAHLSALARAGQAARARQIYDAFVVRLAQELGIEPGAELVALRAALGTPAAPGAAPRDGAGSDDFVGRSAELRRVAALLAQDDCRLLCVIGPGGAGKTRLAQRAQRELASLFADAAIFVALEEVDAAGEIAPRIARELGVRLAGSTDPLEQVKRVLHDRHTLLVLDNFEQLAGSAAILDELLDAAPRVKILVTSRVRLALAREWLLPLEGLPFPEAEDQDRFEAFDAVRLFLRTARRVAPGLNAAAEAAAIIDICRQVEGLPLALQLAAAWTRVLDCAAIAAELRRGSELLSAVDPAQPARHASIEIVFEQSWQLLTPTERAVLARLSAFRGSFAAAAARAVAGASPPLLGALADKSLLRNDGPRMFLHPLVHQFAAARLDGAAHAATHAAHAQYFHRLLAQRRRGVEDGDREALLQIETDFENCRAAWRWAAAEGAADLLARSAITLLEFCDVRARFEEGLALLREALAAPAVAAGDACAPLLASAAAHLEYRLDRYHDATATATQALAAARGTQQREARLQCHKVLGGASLRLGRLDESRRHFGEALKIAKAGADAATAAGMLDNLAIVEKMRGHYDEALRMSTQSLLEHRQAGDAAGEALCLNNLGSLLVDLGQRDAAAAHLRAALDLCERHGLVSTRGNALANLTDLAFRSGDMTAAESYGRQVLEVATSAGNRTLVAVARVHLARVFARRGAVSEARAQVRACLELALAIDRVAVQSAGVIAFAEVLAAQGARAAACRALAFAIEHPSMAEPDRRELRVLLAEWGAPAVLPPWPGIGLGELCRRVVVETDVAYAPLIAQLANPG